MKKVTIYRFVVLLFFVAFTISASARDRSYIRDRIKEYGSCRNVAITKTNGDLMLYGRNGWAADGCPSELTKRLHELHDDGEYIDDVQLTESGEWLILWGDNGMSWSDVPYGLEKKMREYHDRGDVITSVTFNDSGDWLIISREYYAASSSEILEFVQDGAERYGSVWAACITDDAIVVVYEKGYRTLGNVPDGLSEALKNTSWDIYRVKIAGSSWFIADKSGNYNYHM